MPVTHAPGRILAVVYGAAVAGNVLARATLYMGPPSLRTIARWATGVFGYAIMALAMAWLYAAWKGVPESHRGTVSPRRAALSLLIPIYNAYWGVAVNLALCDTLDGILARRGDGRRAPRILAAVAGAVWLGSYALAAAIVAANRSEALVSILLPAVTGGLWLVYMLRCDQVRDTVARIGPDAIARVPPRLSQLQRQRGPGVLAIIGLCLLIVLGLACWQVLSPGDPAPRRAATPRAT
jgi:hypothetical protein